ncbi:hypothetical protein SORBI_3004G183950 [Sorghum bicolor]|uniref:Uncharacterized protein n=1 Tax=Sorghum bicolor TaxID=4558 RepID=A0A1Z5RN46_SORBI|nr:hypothetical protein SORBI_3004G183950 [Sorghum bicolor]
MLGNWLMGIAREERKIIFMGAQLLFGYFGVHAAFRETYWLRFWVLLQREDAREMIRLASKSLEMSPLDIYAKNG